MAAGSFLEVMTRPWGCVDNFLGGNWGKTHNNSLYQVWDPVSGEHVFAIKESVGFKMLQFSTKGHFVRSVAVDGNVKMYDVTSGAEVHQNAEIEFSANVLERKVSKRLTCSRQAIIRDGLVSISVFWGNEATLFLSAAANGNCAVVQTYIGSGYDVDMCYKVQMCLLPMSNVQASISKGFSDNFSCLGWSYCAATSLYFMARQSGCD